MSLGDVRAPSESRKVIRSDRVQRLIRCPKLQPGLAEIFSNDFPSFDKTPFCLVRPIPAQPSDLLACLDSRGNWLHGD
jgi:hypothetical protein